MWGVFNHEQSQEQNQTPTQNKQLNYQPIQQQRSQQTVLPPITRNRSSMDLINNRSYTSEPQAERLLGSQNIAAIKSQRPLLNTIIGSGQNQGGISGLEDYTASFKLPYIQQGASRQELVEVQNKCREVEINLLDLKSSIDRRLAQIIEEIPTRLQRELKNIENRDNHLWKDNNGKMTQIIETVTRIRDQVKVKQQDHIDRIQNLQAMVTDNDFKVASMMKQLEVLQNYQSAQSTGVAVHDPQNTAKYTGSMLSGGGMDTQSSLVKFEKEADSKFLKDLITEERQKREHQLEEHYKMYQHLQSIVHGLENDVMKKLKEHRNDQLSIFATGEEERQRLERMKLERAESDTQYTKQMLMNLERKIEDEQQFRLKNEDDQKRYFENKFIGLLEKMKNEEKLSLERERRLMQQFQEGLVTMNDIIRGTKEQNLISLTHQQTVLGDQIKGLFQTVEAVKDGVMSRQQVIETELGEQRSKMNDLEAATFKHAQTVSETLENEITRFERVISAFEKYIDTQTSDLRGILAKQAEENSKWKGDYEDINTKKVVEIHSALKLLNSNIGKVNSDCKDRFDMINSEMRVHENATNVQIQDLRNKVEVDDKSIEERLQLAVDKAYDRLKQNFDATMNDYNKMVNQFNMQQTEKFEQNNSDVKNFVQSKTDEMRNKILEERRKLDTIVEGKCQAYTIEIERKILQRLQQTMIENQTLREEMLKKMDKATKEQDEVARQLQEERLKIDMKINAKENDIREWALKELQDNYTDFNRLLAAKVLETENKMRQLLANHKPSKSDVPIKDSVTGALSELTLKEAVDNMGMGIKTDLLSLFEDDRKLKNIRFQEVFHLMESNKNLINEHIAQQFESQKALTKAFVNKEVAERTVGDNSILSQLNRRLDGIDALFDGKLKDEVKIMQERLTEQQNMIEEEKKENAAARQKNEESMQKMQEEQTQKLENIKENVDKQLEEGQKKQQEELQKVEGELKKENEEQKKRTDEQEVQIIMNEMINKVIQEEHEVKYETMFGEMDQAIISVLASTQKSLNEQLDDLNTQIKTRTAETINKLQEVIQGLNAEVQESKEKIAKNEKEINEVDFNAKKANEEVKDKIEVTKCVQEMVAWVSEQLVSQQMTDNLNVIAGKFNEVSVKVAENLSKIPADSGPKKSDALNVKKQEKPKPENLNVSEKRPKPKEEVKAKEQPKTEEKKEPTPTQKKDPTPQNKTPTPQNKTPTPQQSKTPTPQEDEDDEEQNDEEDQEQEQDGEEDEGEQQDEDNDQEDDEEEESNQKDSKQKQ
ncbi:UNKNOWN [Stylonychia lemnae]|uniref:Uncharacterized protein n=1 Tax=Stylonychia lemnae TaxID=5949 RepID=A0A078AYJ4_STYLE|nr:UNKNOWN [Stylonychia lemnae]|eukprot:CDW87201.1 UNKNOWN [Stylonychia lemnae]